MEVILDSAFALIEFYEEDALVQITWKKINNMEFEEYKKAIITGLEFQEKHPGKIRHYISDIQFQKRMSTEFKDWFVNEAMPRAKKNGLVSAAVTSGGNFFKRFYLRFIIRSSDRFGIRFKIFSKREDAIRWLKKY